MEELEVGKRKKRSKRNRRGIQREQYKTKVSPPKAAATRVIRCVNKIQKLYEKQSSRHNITHGRITARPGLFNQGRCTSFVQRALHLSPRKKARMDEDLHRIIQLANVAPVKHPRCYTKQSPDNVESVSSKSSKQCVVQDIMDICEETSLGRDISCVDQNKKIKRNESNPSLLVDKADGVDHHRPSGMLNKPFSKLSSSSSSNESSNSSSYSNPPLEVYEEFANSVASTLSSRMPYLFPGRDYLQETRAKIKSKYCHSQMDSLIHHMNPEGSWERATGNAFQRGNQVLNSLYSNAQNTPFPVMVDQAVGSSMQIKPSGIQEVISSEYSPVVVTLSPKTTILNPIEYLKRVEKASKQMERQSNDSGHETSHSRDSNASNSQNKGCLFLGSQDNWNPFHYSLELNDGSSGPSEIAAQKLIYQHSNRSYIDSPQAFELKEANFVAPQWQGQPNNANPFRRESNCLHSNLIEPRRKSVIGQRQTYNLEFDPNRNGFQYLMDVSEITEPNSGYANCSDLLDDLDAADCNLITDSSVLCTKLTKRQPPLDKAMRKFNCSII